MASKNELSREAWYAFSNAGGNSTDAWKYEARAKRYARRIIRKYPTSTEAGQAREILRKLSVGDEVLSLADEAAAADAFASAHSAERGHTTAGQAVRPTASKLMNQVVKDPEWRELFMRFARLSGNKKNLLVIAAFVIFFIPGGLLLYIGLAVLYATRPALLKRHLDRLLTMLGSD